MERVERRQTVGAEVDERTAGLDREARRADVAADAVRVGPEVRPASNTLADTVRGDGASSLTPMVKSPFASVMLSPSKSTASISCDRSSMAKDCPVSSSGLISVNV